MLKARAAATSGRLCGAADSWSGPLSAGVRTRPRPPHAAPTRLTAKYTQARIRYRLAPLSVTVSVTLRIGRPRWASAIRRERPYDVKVESGVAGVIAY